MQNSWTIVAIGLLTLALGCAGAAVQPEAEKPVAAQPLATQAPSPKEQTLLLVTLAGLT